MICPSTCVTLVYSARFWVDFAAWFPFDWIVLWSFDAAQSDNFHRWLGVLTLLRMVCLCLDLWYTFVCNDGMPSRIIMAGSFVCLSFSFVAQHCML